MPPIEILDKNDLGLPSSDASDALRAFLRSSKSPVSGADAARQVEMSLAQFMRATSSNN